MTTIARHTYGQPPEKPKPKTIALDPATVTGAAWTDGRQFIHEVWELPGGVDNHGAAIVALKRNLRAFITAHGCDLLVFEDASFGSNNRATAAYHNALRGAIEEVIEVLGLPKAWKYHPTSLKKATTGNGRASKEQMTAAVNLEHGLKITDDNAADAVAMAALAVKGIQPIGMVKKAQRKVHAKRMKKAPKQLNLKLRF